MDVFSFLPVASFGICNTAEPPPLDDCMRKRRKSGCGNTGEEEEKYTPSLPKFLKSRGEKVFYDGGKGKRGNIDWKGKGKKWGRGARIRRSREEGLNKTKK